MGPISSNSSVSRRSAFSWALLLLIPNVAFFVWLFLGVNPTQVVAAVYEIQDGQPSICRLPVAFLVLGFAFVLLRKVRSNHFGAFSKFVLSTHGTGLVFAGFTLLISFLLGASFLTNVLRAAWGAAVLFGAAGIGLNLQASALARLEAKHFESPLERIAVAIALGLGTLSLAVFVAASMGVMNPWFWRAVVLGFVAANFSKTYALIRELFQAAEKRANETPPVVLVLAVFVVLFLFAHTPLIWNLPVEYDVLEYHLAAPAQYFRAGSVSFLHENMFATFSENGEMLFLLPMMLAGDKIAGLPGAHVLLLAAWALSILLVYALTRRMERSITGIYKRAPSPGPVAAALLFALVPMGSQLAADFYVEHVQTLFHTAALLCGCAFLSDFKIESLFKGLAHHNPTGWLVCAGLCAGFCCGTKYTGLIFTLAPLAVFLPGYCLLTVAAFDALIVLGQFMLPASLVFAPWLVRNGIASGDPLHPLGFVMRRKLAGASGIPDRLDHFEAAVRTGKLSWRAFAASLKQLMPGFRQSYPEDIACGPQLCFFAVPGLSAVSTAETGFVAFVFIADLLAWYFFSHRLNRFFYPHLTALAALGGVGFARIWRVRLLRKVAVPLLAVATLLFAPIQLRWVSESSSREGVAGNASLTEIAKAQIPELPVLALAGTTPQAELPEKARVLFIGEAQTFYCTRTPSYSTVFNTSILEDALHQTKSTEETLRYLRERGITHLYFNYLEWLRLDTSYALTLSDDGSRWDLVRWKENETLDLRFQTMKFLLVRDRKFSDYAAAWPSHVRPAYLKLSIEEYERLGDIYRNHSQRIWPEQDAPLELRELK